MPTFSKARRIAASLASVTGSSPSITSTRRIVATPTFEAAARSSALHRSIARAARIWALVIFLPIGLVFLIQYCIFYITTTTPVILRTLWVGEAIGKRAAVENRAVTTLGRLRTCVGHFFAF